MGERLVTQGDGQAAVAYLIIEGLGDRTEMERATSVKNWNASGVFAIGFGIAFDGSTYIPPCFLKHIFLSGLFESTATVFSFLSPCSSSLV